MFAGLFMLLTLSIVMAIASFLAGSLPLSFSLSQSRLRLVSTIGMGVLVGTSLIVIIPEGVETLYNATVSAPAHARRSIPIHPPAVRWHATTAPPIRYLSRPHPRDLEPTNPFNVLPGPVIPPDTILDTTPPPPKTPTAPNEVHVLSDPPTALPPPPHNPHAWIGLSLILGFILMYLLDTLPILASSVPRPQSQNIYSLSDLSASPIPSQHPSPRRSLSTTLGLCIHAAADGIALGASSTASTTSLSLIIFLAIMVHKAPAAFGLTSILLKQGLGKRTARAHLIVFSLAAPVGAIGTWIVVNVLGGGSADEERMKWWTGLLLLFSGGTFLYVAMHTMQEDEGSAGPAEEMGNGYAEGGMRRERGQKGGRSVGLVAAAVGGMLLPLVTQIGHAH